MDNFENTATETQETTTVEVDGGTIIFEPSDNTGVSLEVPKDEKPFAIKEFVEGTIVGLAVAGVAWGVKKGVGAIKNGIDKAKQKKADEEAFKAWQQNQKTKETEPVETTAEETKEETETVEVKVETAEKEETKKKK